MVDFAHLILSMCILGCLIYIFWLHNGGMIKIQPKQNKKENIEETELDNISYLEGSRDTDSKKMKKLFDDDDN